MPLCISYVLTIHIAGEVPGDMLFSKVTVLGVRKRLFSKADTWRQALETKILVLAEENWIRGDVNFSKVVRSEDAVVYVDCWE